MRMKIRNVTQSSYSRTCISEDSPRL